MLDNKVFLIKCRSKDCGLENYPLNVPSGICAWCGYDGNKDEELKQILERNITRITLSGIF